MERVVDIKVYQEQGYRSDEEIYMAWWLETAMAHGLVLEWKYEPVTFTLCDQHDLLYYKTKTTKAKNPKTTRELATKIMIEQQTYTCDFRIVWNPDYEGVLFKRYDRILKDNLDPYFWARGEKIVIKEEPTNPNLSVEQVLHTFKETGVYVYTVQKTLDVLATYIDIKPGYMQGSQQSHIRFPVKQAWVYDKHGVYVQKVMTVQSVKQKLGRKYNGLFVSTFVPERYLLTDSGTMRRKINFEFKTIQEYVKSATTEKI